MCSIVGAVFRSVESEFGRFYVNKTLSELWTASHARGRDGRGFQLLLQGTAKPTVVKSATRLGSSPNKAPEIPSLCRGGSLIGNLRAEPTTEYVADKHDDDQQPYRCGPWSIVHNGTIANDKELRTWEVPTKIDSAAIAEVLKDKEPKLDEFVSAVKLLKGSYAILAQHDERPDHLFIAANYRPVWYAVTSHGVFVASARDFLPAWSTPQMLEPYSAMELGRYGPLGRVSLRANTNTAAKALVVCSGGLDSVVSAAYAKSLGMEIHLIHFLYGSRAQGPEVEAVQAVAKALDCPVTLFPLNVYSKGDSPLLDPDSKVAGGEEGAEFAHEWVPARNLVLLSVATAFAEARGIDTIVLGNNLEEAGAYPDNEPEFIAKFNDLLPFAVGDGKRMRVMMPVGNMMKHEIVALGAQIGAPMHLTWSCYRAGEKHCGKCGPCYMRRTAFAINNLPEVIEYNED